MSTSAERYLVVGLGNPGKRYSRNRHNLGFQVTDILAARHRLHFDERQQGSCVASGIVAGRRLLVAQPQTYMNESGRAVAGLVNFFKIPLEQVLVVSDDLDLPHGRMRLRSEGGAGGQRGVRSIIQHLGADGFARLRIGIGRPPGRMAASAYVLQDFSPDQEKELEIIREEAVDAIELWLSEGIVAAMNRYN